MERKFIAPRKNWQQIVENQGLPYHSAGGIYWQDDVHYQLSAQEADYINYTTNVTYEKIHGLVKEMMANSLQRARIKVHMVNSGMCPDTVDAIFENWDAIGQYKTRTSYGRFDLAFDKNMRLKMFEYNADTPVVLIETGYCQWEWLTDQFGDAVGEDVSQINELYPELLEMFTAWRNQGIQTMVFTCDKGQIGEVFEYEASCLYLMEIASEVGIKGTFRFVGDLEVGDKEPVITVDGEVPDAIFKLYPAEWMVEDLRAQKGRTNAADVLRLNNLIEEPFKLLMGGKWLLPYLYERYKNITDVFIPAWHDRGSCLDKKVVAKSYYGRIGMEVEVLEPGQLTSLEGPVIYQEFTETKEFDGWKPVLCSWTVNGRSAGLGIREQLTDITTDSCRFASHVVVL